MTWRTPTYTGPERRRVKRWRPRPLRVLVFLLAVLAIGYTVGVLSLVSEESTLVFEAGRTFGELRPSFPYTQIDLPRRDGARQFAWIMPRDIADEGIWALYLHGNASTIASSVNISHYRELRRVGLSVLAPEYRGFAGLAGQPTEGALDADARAAYDYLRTQRHVAPERIVVFGWSLGSALAVDLAQGVEQAAVILEGAPTSQAGLTQRRYPFFPVRLLIRNPFDSRSKIAGVHSPLLFLHATDDQVVPIAEGRRLFDAARGDKTFVEVRGGHFGAVDVDASAFSQAIRRFLDAHGLTGRQPARNGA
ncbi:MAG TPA: alpha/beta fold hydrolase [Vicinamibacterales bacterium]